MDSAVSIIRPNTRMDRGFWRSLRSIAGELLRHRRHIVDSILLDFRLQFRKSHFGRFWYVVNCWMPLIIFGGMAAIGRFAASGNIHALAYVVCGWVFWTLMVEIVQAPRATLQSNAGVFQQTQLPLSVMIFVGYARSVVGFAVRFPILLAACAYFAISAQFLGFLVPALLVAVTFAVGLGLLLAIYSLGETDMPELVDLFLRYGLFLSCVIFPLPGGIWEYWQLINPFAVVINTSRELILLGETTRYVEFSVVFAASFVTAVVCLRVLYLLEPRLKGNM